MSTQPLGNVSLHDLYARLGNIEEQVKDTAVEVAAIKAALNGPVPLRQRVERLENWRWMIVGGFGVVTFGVMAIGTFSFLLR